MQKKGRRRNAYQVLQIDQHATTKDIRKAFTAWKRRVKTQLQKGAGTDEGDKRKREDEKEAYEILSNETKRAKYDEALEMTRKKLLAKIEKHCFNTDGDPASINASDFEELDTEALRRIYVIYDSTSLHKLLEEIPDDAPDTPKGSCMEDITLIHMWKSHQKKNENGMSTPWANPTSRKPLSRELANDIAERIAVRNVELISAVDADDLDRVQFLLANGAGPNGIYSKNSKTPLINHAILVSAKIPIIEALLKAGANVNNSNIHGVTTLLCVKYYKHDKKELLRVLKEYNTDPTSQLIYAIKGDNISGISELIEFGANINGLVEKFPPLIHAMQMSASLPMIQELLNRGASVNVIENKTVPIFGVVVYNGDKIAVLKLLLEHNANINMKDPAGKDLLFWAITYQNDSELLKSIVDHGADLTTTYTMPNNIIHTPLTLAMYYQRPRNILKMLIEKHVALINKPGSMGSPIILAIFMKSDRLFDWCIEHGTDTQVLDNLRRNLLMNAIINGTEYMVNKLITMGFDVNVLDAQGNTTLHCTIPSGNVELAKRLLEAGVNINVKNSKGNTALHSAIGHRRLDIAKYLIEHGANTMIRNTMGVMPIHLSLVPEAAPIFDDLWRIYKENVPKERYDDDLFLAACRSRVPHAIVRMLEAGMNAKAMDARTGASTLIYAVSYAHDIPILTSLIDHGADVHHQDQEGRNALMYAVMTDHNDAVDFLLSKGVDKDHRDVDGATALHLACGIGEGNMVKKLIAAGCDVNALTHLKSTPLMIASELVHIEAVKALLEAGADPNKKNNYKHTALFYIAEHATDENAQECVNVLLQYGAEMTDRIRQILERHNIIIPQDAGRNLKRKQTKRSGCSDKLK